MAQERLSSPRLTRELRSSVESALAHHLGPKKFRTTQTSRGVCESPSLPRAPKGPAQNRSGALGTETGVANRRRPLAQNDLPNGGNQIRGP